MKSAVLAAMLLAVPALAEVNGFEIRIANRVSPEQPSTDVEVWARFDPHYFAFAYSAFRVDTRSVLYGGDEGSWPDFECVVSGYNSSPGTLSKDGSDVLGALPGQEHLHPGPPADDSNPILVWRGTWTTTDFTARDVKVAAGALWFDVYVEDNWWAPQRKNLRDIDFSSIPGFITVVPAPGCAVPLFVVSALARIRRRRA